MITLFAAILSVPASYVYMQVINPGLKDLIVQSQTQKLEAKGITGEKAEQVEAITRKFMTPGFMAAAGFLQMMFAGTLISLVSAAFLKRTASDSPPLVA